MNAERAFDQPWQAQALAMAVALQDAGVISAGEWAEALGSKRNGDGLRDDGGDYYDSVVAALEEVIAAKHLASKEAISELADAWTRAAHATPHGKPVVLDNDPEGRGDVTQEPR
ncbi:MAG: nitrile hydratase accessory protein [Rhizobiaceae bacterium]